MLAEVDILLEEIAENISLRPATRMRVVRKMSSTVIRRLVKSIGNYQESLASMASATSDIDRAVAAGDADIEADAMMKAAKELKDLVKELS